jgi:hypothetical protein
MKDTVSHSYKTTRVFCAVTNTCFYFNAESSCYSNIDLWEKTLIETRIKLDVKKVKKKCKAVSLHAMEAHGVRGLNLGTRWGWVVSVTPWPRFTPGERTPGTHWIGGWAGPRAGLDAEARRKILCPFRGSNPDCPARSQTLYCLSYRGSRT